MQVSVERDHALGHVDLLQRVPHRVRRVVQVCNVRAFDEDRPELAAQHALPHPLKIRVAG